MVHYMSMSKNRKENFCMRSWKRLISDWMLKWHESYRLVNDIMSRICQNQRSPCLISPVTKICCFVVVVAIWYVITFVCHKCGIEVRKGRVWGNNKKEYKLDL